MFLPEAKKQPAPGVYRWLVVIVREGVPEVTGFWEGEDAEKYFEDAWMNWTDSFLIEVVKGPRT
jgi:hypothetical protein